MAALEEGLDPELFVRLHRSAIVRKDFIAGFYAQPVGPLDCPAGGRHRAAGRPALFGPRPGHRRPLTVKQKKPPRVRGRTRGGSRTRNHLAVTTRAVA